MLLSACPHLSHTVQRVGLPSLLTCVGADPQSLISTLLFGLELFLSAHLGSLALAVRFTFHPFLNFLNLKEGDIPALALRAGHSHTGSVALAVSIDTQKYLGGGFILQNLLLSSC